MKLFTIALELPEVVLKEAQDIARGGNCSVESVLQDGLATMFGDSVDYKVLLKLLEGLGDEQLWKAAHHQLTLAQDSRWRELMALGKSGALTAGEKKELDNLADLIDRRVLIRSKALVLLKQRGYDIDAYLGFGA